MTHSKFIILHSFGKEKFEAKDFYNKAKKLEGLLEKTDNTIKANGIITKIISKNQETHILSSKNPISKYKEKNLQTWNSLESLMINYNGFNDINGYNIKLNYSNKNPSVFKILIDSRAPNYIYKLIKDNFKSNVANISNLTKFSNLKRFVNDKIKMHNYY